jgi:fructose-1,6-bisphosphatase I
MNLRGFFAREGLSKDLEGLLQSLFISCEEISEVLRGGFDHGVSGSQNDFGEEQMAFDLRSNRIIIEKITNSGVVNSYSSEEVDGEVFLNHGELNVVFDPLDGSSLVDCNMAVGSIFGIYRAQSVVGLCGRDQEAALVAVYGPSLSFLLTVFGRIFRFEKRGAEIILVDEDLKLMVNKKYFAPGALAAAAFEGNYRKLVEIWINESYKLRYSGGMVPDLYHLFVKGGGIFCYPATPDKPHGKLRLLFECAPFALLVEAAGGSAVDAFGRAILDLKIDSLTRTTSVFIGSKAEVEKAIAVMNE